MNKRINLKLKTEIEEAIRFFDDTGFPGIGDQLLRFIEEEYRHRANLETPPPGVWDDYRALINARIDDLVVAILEQRGRVAR